LHMLVDVVVQTRKRAGKFEVEEVYFDPAVGRTTAH
jgi:type IV secretion system protein VirB11